MFKRIGISMALLAGLVAFAAPKQAEAKVHIGVYLGAPAPVYTAPAYPAYGYDSYVDPYATPYVYPAPVYVSPYSYGGGYYRNYGHERHEWRERMEHERHEMREHGRGRRR
jgi:hypothetical protein